MSISKFDEAYMKMAGIYSQLSHDHKTKVGCVLVKDNRIIAAGYNGTPTGTSNEMRDSNDDTLSTVIHAEMNAIIQAAKSSISTDGAVAYTTLLPCIHCSIHLYQAGIRKVIYKDIKQHSTKIEGVTYESYTEDDKVSE